MLSPLGYLENIIDFIFAFITLITTNLARNIEKYALTLPCIDDDDVTTVA